MRTTPHPGRLTAAEITKADGGHIVVATWKWSNGWNLSHVRPATPEEVTAFKYGNGFPVPCKVSE